jgi:hypothetical protein
VKDAFAKNFLVSGEIPLAARSHRFFGNTLVKAGHLIRPSVVSGTVRGLALQGGQGLAAPIQKTAPVKANQRLTVANPRPRRHWAAKIISATGKPTSGDI